MGILEARILEWGAMPSFRGASRPRDGTHISCLLHWQAGSLPPSGVNCGPSSWEPRVRTAFLGGSVVTGATVSLGQAELFGLTAEEVYLVHDELDKPLGKVALKLGGSAR